MNFFGNVFQLEPAKNLRDITSERRSATIFIPFSGLREVGRPRRCLRTAADPTINGLGLGMDRVSYHAALDLPSCSGAQVLSVILERLCPY